MEEGSRHGGSLRKGNALSLSEERTDRRSHDRAPLETPMNRYGWKGRRLKVHLDGGKSEISPIDSETLEAFIGGRGLNSILLYREIQPGTDPLGNKNILCLAVGPLNGTLAPTSGKMTISAKSPLTGIHGDANTGGFFCSEMKFAGYDQIAVYGKASQPTYLWIKDDRIEMRDASRLWGKDTWETDRLIKEELGDPNVQIVSIGQAGENQVKFAGVISNLTRIAGRTGMGTVMGSKRLKAIAIRGSGNVEVASPVQFKQACLKTHSKIKATGVYQLLHNFGTPFLLDHTNEVGRLSTRNCQQGWFEGVEKVGVEVLRKNYLGKNRGCASCPVLCGHTYSVPVGELMNRGDSAEYENIASFSAMVGNDDVEVALYASTMCDRYGLDTISTGYAIAFAMELWEKGFISENDTNGLQLGWGNRQAILSLLDQIAHRSSTFGDLLAEGVQSVSRKFPGSERFAMVIKGNPCNVGDYRATKGGAFAQAVATRGADHLRGSPVIEYMGVSPDESEKIFGHILGREKARSLVDYRAYFGKPSAEIIHAHNTENKDPQKIN